MAPERTGRSTADASLIAYAPQNAVLFEASLRENLLLGVDRPEQDIEAWLQQLGLAHLLQRHGGLDAPLSLAQDPFQEARFTVLGCCGPGCATNPLKCLMNPQLFWIQRLPRRSGG